MASRTLRPPLGFGKAAPDPEMDDEDYLAQGRRANRVELTGVEDDQLFRLLEDEDGLEGIVDVPFGIKHVKDLQVVMRHAVAVTGDEHEELTSHSLFHPAFASFSLGFAIGLAQAHRLKHLGHRSSFSRLPLHQRELCDQWGVEIATYYVAVVDSSGIFDKMADLDLYGISDKWRLLADPKRLEDLARLKDCVDEGKQAAREWSDHEAEVPPRFLGALMRFIESNPGRRFD